MLHVRKRFVFFKFRWSHKNASRSSFATQKILLQPKRSCCNTGTYSIAPKFFWFQHLMHMQSTIGTATPCQQYNKKTPISQYNKKAQINRCKPHYSITSTATFAGAFSFGLPLFFSIRALVTTTLSRFTRFFDAGDGDCPPCFDPTQPIAAFSFLWAYCALMWEVLVVLCMRSTADPPGGDNKCLRFTA